MTTVQQQEEEKNIFTESNLTPYYLVKQQLQDLSKTGKITKEETKKCLNQMTSILHKEHPDWAIKKILTYIRDDNPNTPRFCVSYMYTLLNDENRQLVDHRRISRYNKINLIEETKEEEPELKELKPLFQPDEKEEKESKISYLLSITLTEKQIPLLKEMIQDKIGDKHRNIGYKYNRFKRLQDKNILTEIENEEEQIGELKNILKQFL